MFSISFVLLSLVHSGGRRAHRTSRCFGGAAILGSEWATPAARTLSRRAGCRSLGMSAKGERHTGIPAEGVCDAWSLHSPLQGVSCLLTQNALMAVLVTETDLRFREALHRQAPDAR